MPKKGEKLAYRPRPEKFAETYVKLGLNRTVMHFRAHKRTVFRWIGEVGAEHLRMQRLEYMTTHGVNPGVLKVWHRKRLKELSGASDFA